MAKDPSCYLTPEGQAPKFPVLQENILSTRVGHDRVSGGCSFCFHARDPQNMSRSPLCKCSVCYQWQNLVLLQTLGIRKNTHPPFPPPFPLIRFLPFKFVLFMFAKIVSYEVRNASTRSKTSAKSRSCLCLICAK